MRLVATLIILACILVFPSGAQLPNTKLKPTTIQEFETYTSNVERQLNTRWRAGQNFTAVESSPDDLKKVLQGNLLVRPATPNNPIDISDGLINDWVGDVFIPNTTVKGVLDVLQDFDHHSKIYPSITNSRLVRRTSDHAVGYWRLEEKNQVIPVTLDVIDDATYEEVAPGKWICRAYAKDIAEVENAGSPNEKKLPPGEGSGLLWRLYGYWTLQARDGGVLAECRSISLSRGVPGAVAWMVKPFLKNFPKDSLTSTLRDTRNAAVNAPTSGERNHRKLAASTWQR